MRHLRTYAIPVLALTMLAWTGCGGNRPDLATVHGRITLNGQPLPQAQVRFDPVDAVRGSTGGTDQSGQYKLSYLRGDQGAAIGEHRVTILKFLPDGRQLVPPQYNEQTTLTATVEPGANEINFDLTSSR